MGVTTHGEGVTSLVHLSNVSRHRLRSKTQRRS